MLFASYISDLEVKKLAIQNCQWAQTKKEKKKQPKPQKNLLSLVKESGKGKPKKERKLFKQPLYFSQTLHTCTKCGFISATPAMSKQGA